LVAARRRQTVFVSLDGGTAASFEATRGARTWERALGGLEALLDARGHEVGPRLGIYQLDLGVDPEDYDRRFLSLIDRVDDYRRVRPVEVVLLIEESDSADFARVKRNLQTLRAGGWLCAAQGIGLGRLRQTAVRWWTDEAADSALLCAAEDTHGPVVSALEFGHVDPLLTIPVGAPARLDASKAVRLTVYS
jgi:LD-carboxypeptidase C-terminal domain